MRYIYVFFFSFLFISCSHDKRNYSEIILKNNKINKKFIEQLDEPEKALLSWYLYAYGNECDGESSKIKCDILQELNIDDECNPKHLNNLLQWFSNDMLAVYKLNKCPNITSESAIQNTFESIILSRNKNKLSIEITTKGLNTIQEKSWNKTQTDTYLIKNKTFIKINKNE